MKSFKNFLEQKTESKSEENQKAFLNQLGLPGFDIGEGMQIKMSSFEASKLDDIKKRILPWTKFQAIEDQTTKKDILSMIYNPKTSLNDIYKIIYNVS